MFSKSGFNSDLDNFKTIIGNNTSSKFITFTINDLFLDTTTINKIDLHDIPNNN
ncbi:hypothetical protein FACS189459_6440 [Bacilli bacterium]|nr:hypothetical protein FACS189459_6440 [Bacilli bacterium]